MSLIFVVDEVLQLNAQLLGDLGKVGLIEDASYARDFFHMSLFHIVVVDEIDGDGDCETITKHFSGEVYWR